jgi:hypothetical protein
MVVVSLALRIFKPAAYDCTGFRSKPRHMAAVAAPAVPDHMRNNRRVSAILPPFLANLMNVYPEVGQHL